MYIDHVHGIFIQNTHNPLTPLRVGSHYLYPQCPWTFLTPVLTARLHGG